ncbi:MAG: hypothetical protein ABJ327_26925, partial [Litoreibacter sp.]
MAEGGFYVQWGPWGGAVGWDSENGITVSGFQSVVVGPSADAWVSWSWGGGFEGISTYVGGGVPIGVPTPISGNAQINMQTGETFGTASINLTGINEFGQVGVYGEGSLSTDWSYTVSTQVHGQGQDQLTQRFNVIGSVWENGERVDIVHVTEIGPAGRNQWIYTVPHGQTEIDRLNAEASAIGPAAGTTGGGNQCFLSDTPIQMWPLDPLIKPRADGSYDEAFVLSKVWEKPISEIKV